MKITVDKLSDDNWFSLIERMHGVAELRQFEHTIIGVTTVLGNNGSYYGAVFSRVNDVKEPAVAAKVIPINDGYRHEDDLSFGLGGCVSGPTVSEQLQEDLEPIISDHGKRFCI